MKGMVTAMDDAVGTVVAALRKYKMLQNSIIVFTTDVSTSKYHRHPSHKYCTITFQECISILITDLTVYSMIVYSFNVLSSF